MICSYSTKTPQDGMKFMQVGSPPPRNGLPSVFQCTTHLELLNLFVNLRHEVEKWGAVDPDRAWATYVKLAAGRFTAWFRSVTASDIKISLPPLDILMVWHAFMLNPMSYVQFCKTLRPDQVGFVGIPWAHVHEAIDPSSEMFVLPVKDLEKAQTQGLQPDLLAFLREIGLKPLSIDELLADWYALSLEKGFETHWLEELEALNKADFTYSSHDIDFDPAAAVHRQADFALKMSQFGWLYSPTLTSTLERSVVRYQRFFALLAQHPGNFLVPTLDVDLVWHTHQLSPKKYAIYCKATTSGRFINHDDQVENHDLKSGFGHTQTLYRDLCAEEYKRCHSWLCEAALTAAKTGAPFSGPKILALKALITHEKIRKARLGLPSMLDYATCHCLCEKLRPTGQDAEQVVKSIAAGDESTTRCICGDINPRFAAAYDGISDCDENFQEERCGGSCTSCNGNCSTSCSSSCSAGCGGG